MPKNVSHPSQAAREAGTQPQLGSQIAARGPPGTPASLCVVGIGASAGGLEACTALLAELHVGSGIACILVQHLDPTHDSMLVDLLSLHAPIPVLQAADGMDVQADHFYIIPPAFYLTVKAGRLQLSEKLLRHGARLPFDVLLHSLAAEYGAHAMCVILSGTGTDGTAGLKAVKEKGGLVVAQDPAEAGYAGMPQSAIATGLVDLVLPAASMAPALIRHARQEPAAPADGDTAPPGPAAGALPEIIALLRTRTPHDFTLYKPGTLQRRVERRMAMAGVPADGMARYAKSLRDDPAELEQLAKDFLINVTGFFRDSPVFEALEKTVIPELIRTRRPDRPIRVWIAGCSTGEESYSLAMIFREQLAAHQPDIKLQVFASDIDADAVAVAREGFYAEALVQDMAAERLARFFTREEGGWRVSQDLRSAVVFTVQDLLADPPFSRLDLISCRNLLIYLQPEAQARVLATFHFALREGGILLLGSAEGAGSPARHFEVVSKPNRIYRHLARSEPGDNGFPVAAPGTDRLRLLPGQSPGLRRQPDLAEISRRLVLDTVAPAAVLIDQNRSCVFSLGPTDRFFRLPSGDANLDVLAMARPGLRSRLNLAIQQARAAKSRTVVPCGRVMDDHAGDFYDLDIQPVTVSDQTYWLICFVPAAKPPLPAAQTKASRAKSPDDRQRIARLEHENDVMAAELKAAIRDLDASAEEQKAINEEALSVNEEHQSTNEELLTSKEELQSLNEELTALNSQLQETLERQRKTANDLQNVLYSTDIATLFLDDTLCIRFFTPAVSAIFNVIAGDIGRPLADLHALVPDAGFAEDASRVLRSPVPVEREIEGAEVWFIRRIMPYRTQQNGVEGLVVTYTDITERKRTARGLELAQQRSDAANVGKSRFLAAASHDLRQPLQTLILLQALMARNADGDKQRKLVQRLGDTIESISGMLNTLLDINQIDLGIIRPEVSSFAPAEMFARLHEELGLQATAKGLSFRVVPCSVVIRSDQRLLEQMVRNLISNAFKYTRTGKVLVGCRRHGGQLRIEVWDTGIGIAKADMETIFEEYRQLDNAARERSLGLGLGLPIVQRLADLLGHRIDVRSRAGHGSMFSIEVARDQGPPETPPTGPTGGEVSAPTEPAPLHGTILLVEDDPDIAEFLGIFLRGEGHRVTIARDGPAALAHIERAALQPSLLLTDYNLPNQMNGLDLAAAVRLRLHQDIPVIVLTGDISIQTLNVVTDQHCRYLSKPVSLDELSQTIETLLLPEAAAANTPIRRDPATSDAKLPIHIVDDDAQVRDVLCAAVQEDGRTATASPSAEAFLAAYRPGEASCLVLDANLPGMSGVELLRQLRRAGDPMPCLMITGNSDIAMAVTAMKAGATDFIEKPIGYDNLLAAIDQAIDLSRDATKRTAWRQQAAGHIADLTARQRQIMALVLAGHPSKNIAADLGISQRTVENHRASIMKRTGAHSLPALARLAVTAALTESEGEWTG
jgi:two-component system CheB/CheR fusion protein